MAQELEDETTTITTADVAAALALIAEASPELREMMNAEEDEAETT